MKVYGLWYGGSSYAVPAIGDLEEFVSQRAAETVLWERFHDGGTNLKTYFVSRENESATYPAVSPDCEMHVFTYDPRGHQDPHPSYILKFGPKGGISRETY